MANLDGIQIPVKANLLVAFIDIARFTSFGKKIDGLKLFDLMNGMAVTAIRSFSNSVGRIIKFIGDSILIVFPEESADEGVLAIMGLHDAIVDYFVSQGKDNIRLSVGIHVGEVVIGPFGEDPYKSIDVFGDNVNRAALLAGRENKGKIVLSPQAFRKLKPGTRKRFHKYTPPIVYIAD